MYNFSLLVSCPWTLTGRARREIAYFLRQLGDEKPTIKPTVARGIIGVKTRLDSREVVQKLISFFNQDPSGFRYTLKWVPVDLWADSDIESLKGAVQELRNKVKLGAHRHMTLEKRRYTQYHKIDIIRTLAELIGEKVGLKNPDKILRIDIIGKYAGVSVISPSEIFSTTKLNVDEAN